jgi:hypothetical protein
MASHDTEIRKLRALAQDNSVTIQKLHEEVRKLKNRLDLERLKTGGSSPSQPRNSQKSDPEKPGT